MNIEDIHDFIRFIERKERGAFHTPDEMDEALDMGQMDYFAECFDEYGRTQKLHDALSSFKVTYSFSNASSPLGLVTLPSTYLHLLDGYTVVYDNSRETSRKRNITFVNEDERTAALDSQLRPVTILNPLGEQKTSLTIQLYPETPQAGVITYLKRPAVPKYAYTQVGRAITYDSANSTQLEWSDLYIRKVILKALSYLGVNLNDQALTQYSEAKAQEK